MKKLLLLSALTIVFVNILFSQNVPSHVPTNGLVGYWPFNGNANDESGNANNGTVNGAVLTTDKSGKNNSAYSFSPSASSNINIPNSSSLQFNGAISISVWFNSTNLPSPTSYILSKGSDGGTPNSWVLPTYPNGSISFDLFNNTGTANSMFTGSGTGAIINNEWVNFIFTLDATSGKCYKNGQLILTKNSSSFNLSNIYDIKIGRRYLS